jgi:predicted alpha/beta superfamily hydrolase
MRKIISFTLALLLAVSTSFAMAQNQTSRNLVEQLLQSRPDLFGEVLKNIEKHEVQILYTQIDRDRNNRPAFRSYSYRVNPKEYFYPASTVKLPAAVLALEKLNNLGIKGLNKYTSLRLDSAYAGQTAVTRDSSAMNYLPSIAHYVKKIFLVSDNDAYNRLYEFLGQRALNEALWKKGFKDLKLTRRLSVSLADEQNRYTNPFTFYDGGDIIYQQPLGFNPVIFKNKLQTTLRGKGYLKNGELVNSPMDFSLSNYISLENLQGILKAVLFPEAVKSKQRFHLQPDDYAFLYKYMSMLPRESDYPKYDTTEYYDSYVKYFLFGDSKQRMPSPIRLFNKVGEAYGYLTDNAYVVDFENKIEFLLTAVIYVNDDQIFNDDKYEYDTIGMPFLANLGRVVYEYEKTRPRRYLPNLDKFKIEYDNEPKSTEFPQRMKKRPTDEVRPMDVLSADSIETKLPQEPEITLKVIAPPSTPSEAKIFVAGNHPFLGNWDPGKVELTKQNDSLWTITRSFPKKFFLEFKITRGSWNAQAIYQAGAIPGNTQFVVRNDTAVTIRPQTWSDLAFRSGGGITGTVKYHRGLTHPKLRHPRDVIVWLPPSYEKDTRQRYPVLYMHDGQNIIDPSTSFLGADWRVDEVADSLIRAQKIEEIIVVGIYNSPDRNPEYSDTELGRAYADFVVHQLKPMIDSTYRTKPEAKNTAVMGSSMGGLISFLFVWWHPEVFSKVGCLSSAFLVDDNKILREVRAYTGPQKPIRVYLDDGSEGLEARLKPGYDEMVALLLEKGYVKGADLEYFYDLGAEHNERAWARRLWRALGFVFGR